MKNSKIDKKDAIFAATKGVLNSFAKKIPIVEQLIDGLENYQNFIKEQMRTNLLCSLEDRIQRLETGDKEKLVDYSRTPEGAAVLQKLIESSLNAEYKEKQEIFINAMLNAPKTDALEDEKMRFIDLIRSLSKVALHVLYAIYEEYDNSLDDRMTSSQIATNEIVTKAYKMFKYSPELIESALRELKSCGLFSNITRWHKNSSSGSFSIAGHIANESVAYTVYSRQFVEFIRK